ncbi:MAG: NUDIX hydrolase [Sedimentisphaerales bacterium]|nr:NUDIX hydrolase [Sedimentisphaerales bacterium]
MATKGTYIYEWPRPMVSADAVVFQISAEKTSILLIKRKHDPFRGQWAIPGGFLEMDEELDVAAARELAEETGLTGVHLEQMHTFGTLGRDPRGRMITVTFIGIADEQNSAIKAGDDAAEARWFDIENLPDNLAFDHDKVIKFAIAKLRAEKNYE